ncbi:MAG: sacsin N-terminal ATP-binding-like domain-containing protein [Bacilli bacterium]
MSYNSKLQESRQKVYEHAVATKILDLMDNLRQSDLGDSSRRWIWELMQNAKDVAHIGLRICLEIDFRSDNATKGVVFKHTGSPFSMDNITFLIEQVSTKDRDKKDGTSPKTTGKFGTGFLTTHLLSEKVEIEGVLKEPDESYRKFNIVLDRTGRSTNEMVSSVDKSLLALENIDAQENYDQYSPDDFNTVFRYILDQDGVRVAQKGLDDLRASLIYTLVFLPEIKFINIVHEKARYELSDTVLQEGNDISIYTVIKRNPGGVSETKIALVTKNGTSIAVEIEYENGRIGLKAINTVVPRLFCDFPLVGSEDFPFPVIINSASFNPNEPRNGVYLTDRSDPRIQENKSIIAQAMELYTILLEYASRSKWDNIYQLAVVPKPKAKEWMSRTWVQEQVIDPIREKLLRTPIVDTENNDRISIISDEGKTNAWFPSAGKQEHRHRIWALAMAWIPSHLPRKSDIDIWHDIAWRECDKLSAEGLTRSIHHRGNLAALGEALAEGTSSVDWLNSYFELLSLEDEYMNDIANDKYSVIPNQYGEFKQKSKLMHDEEIEEELKNVLTILEEDPKSYLKHKNIGTGKLKCQAKSQAVVIQDINRIITQGQNIHIGEACDYLVTLFPNDNEFPLERESLFQFCKTVFPQIVNVKRHLGKWSKEIWQEVDRLETMWIVNAVSETGNVANLAQKFNFSSASACLEWLNSLVVFLTRHHYGHLLNQEDSPMLPNQHGSFLIKDELFLDEEIDEELKDICADLGRDFRNELLDAAIYLDLSNKRTVTEVAISEEIGHLVTLKFGEFPRTSETRRIFKRFYLWLTKNYPKSQTLFDDLYANKHRFYDDDEVAESIQKAEMYSEIMNEFGLNTVEDLREILHSYNTQSRADGQTQITQDTLVSLGVTSVEELEKALADKDLAAQFTHTTTPTVEMFLYVQGLISRAKKNVIEHLIRHPDYDCSELEELAPTVIGGIKKDGLMIHVVVRPSDNGEVIVYYSSEKDTLDYANAELWIDNGIDDPLHLTLGKILKKTGINRIPI